MLKKLFKFILTLIIIIIVFLAVYAAYVLISYHRIEDNQSIDVEGTAENTTAQADKKYRIISANLGFGAYSDDYSFFMDGGTESWAYSKDAVKTNLNGSMDAILGLSPDFIALQEVDLKSTRSYKVDESEIILDRINSSSFGNSSRTFAINYDSPFLLYPITQPHGKSYAGIYTISSVQINSATRRSLPIEEGMSKLIDLDRCYCKNYIDVDNGKKLVLYNVHLSAYTTDPATAQNQVVMLNEDMRNEFAAGNYIIAAGDMNKDVLGDSTKYFNTSAQDQLWAKPFPVELLDDDFSVVKPVDENDPVPSARNADTAYTKDSFVITIDGFIVSSNVEVTESNVVNTGFKYSDHNPVFMDFILK